MSNFFIILIIFVVSVADAKSLPINLLKLPHNFSIKLFADSVKNARQMTLGNNGTVFVGSLHAGNVYAIVPGAQGNRVITIASNLNMPNGVAFYNNALYVAENHRIIRFDDIENHLTSPLKPVVIATLPQKKHHGWRYIHIGNDQKLYVGIGAPCNACLSEENYFATIMRMNLDGSHPEIYAKGVRNTVGFDWDPVGHKLWFTDNGRDLLGDDVPPDELNFVSHVGEHFGFPYCHGKNVSDPYYGKLHSCTEFVAPALELPAHVAALGMTFYRGNLFPPLYKNQIFIAEHGSWNRSSKVGYQVIRVKIENNRVIENAPFITGWLQGQSAWGRPVDILNLPDGSLLISDDYAGVIYQVSYSNELN